MIKIDIENDLGTLKYHLATLFLQLMPQTVFQDEYKRHTVIFFFLVSPRTALGLRVYEVLGVGGGGVIHISQ